MKKSNRGAEASSEQSPTVLGNAGEIHQQAASEATLLTTNQGVPVGDNQNSLKAGARGPVLLQDFILREKIMHFDHERIPERVVHARGFGRAWLFRVPGAARRNHPCRLSCRGRATGSRFSPAFPPSPATRGRPIWRATSAALRSSSTPRRAISTWSATTSRCSSSRTRSSFPT